MIGSIPEEKQYLASNLLQPQSSEEYISTVMARKLVSASARSNPERYTSHQENYRVAPKLLTKSSSTENVVHRKLSQMNNNYLTPYRYITEGIKQMHKQNIFDNERTNSQISNFSTPSGRSSPNDYNRKSPMNSRRSSFTSVYTPSSLSQSPLNSGLSTKATSPRLIASAPANSPQYLANSNNKIDPINDYDGLHENRDISQSLNVSSDNSGRQSRVVSVNSSKISSHRSSITGDNRAPRKFSQPINALAVALKLRESQDKTLFLRKLKKDITRNRQIPDSFDRTNFYVEIYDLLQDKSYEIRRETTLLMKDLLPYFGPENCGIIANFLPNLTVNLGHHEISLQKASSDLIRKYIKMTGDVQYFIDELINTLRMESFTVVKERLLQKFYRILNGQFRGAKWNEYIHVSFDYLKNADLKDVTLDIYHRIMDIMGEETMLSILSKIEQKKAKNIRELLFEEENESLEQSSSPGPDNEQQTTDPDEKSSKESLLYGVIPKVIVEKILYKVSYSCYCYLNP